MPEEIQQKMSNGVNKFIITIVIAVVTVGGYLVFFRGAPQPTPLASEQSSQQTITQPPASKLPASEQPSQQPPVSQTPAVKENVVIYTDSGYAPSTLTIKKGETVTFKNQSSRSMWPASAMHPTHRVYSGTSLDEHCPDTTGTAFDACKGFLPGESWSFKFDKVGSWKYHDHLNPGATGTIVVE
jgi:plastocyanin